MIAVRLEGRLGNQLFQYAFIYSAAKKLNTSFYIDKSIENFLPPKYFDVKNNYLAAIDNRIFSINGFKNIFRVHARKAFYHLISNVILRGRVQIVETEAEPGEILKTLKNNRLYQGFFYSAGYFEDCKDDIRRLYTIREKYAAAFDRVNNRLDASKKKAVVHVRRGDYVDLNYSLPLSYYKKVIETIDAPEIEYVFISDDPSFIENEFSHIPNKYISRHDEITDLQFLINADICILSCSSFSWWGAWLNNGKDKQIYAPQYWLGFKDGKEFPAGVSDHMNINWVQV
ncbi:MAG: alpha-1,2-fucosyltransferase [Bacteroidetes bacterium]|nr:alpha-1,2-fucosyltransferase [Bacteroidota bacterium]